MSLETNFFLQKSSLRKAKLCDDTSIPDRKAYLILDTKNKLHSCIYEDTIFPNANQQLFIASKHLQDTLTSTSTIIPSIQLQKTSDVSSISSPSLNLKDPDSTMDLPDIDNTLDLPDLQCDLELPELVDTELNHIPS